MSAKIIRKVVGPWPMNTYLVYCDDTDEAAIINPGADADVINKWADDFYIRKILITHGHADHVGAIHDVKDYTGSDVFINPSDAEKFNLTYDYPLEDGNQIWIGKVCLRTIHTPGHTPGMTSFYLDDNRVIVGDTIFVGGPGKTWSPQDFTLMMRTMKEIVFKWPDETIFFPGHGQFGVIGSERTNYDSFFARGWSPDLFGDVTWV